MDNGSSGMADKVTHFESLALQSTFTTPNITLLPFMDTEMQQTTTDLQSSQQVEQKNNVAGFAKLEDIWQG